MKIQDLENFESECADTRALMFDYPDIKGPWLSEPDRVEFRSNRFDCLIVRNPKLFSLCGYVGLDEFHPFYGKMYSEIDDNIDVHGGLTFASKCYGVICHSSEPKDDKWWFGFDCAHFGDLTPSLLYLAKRKKQPQEDYKNISYVIDETISLAKQLKSYSK